MPEIIVGSVGVTVVPDVQRFARDLAAQILPAADQVGREAGKRIGEGIENSVNNAVKRSAAKALAAAGVDGKAIGVRLGQSIKAAAEAARPEVKAEIKLDQSALTAFIAEVKSMRPEVKTRISLDKPSFASFMAEVKSMRPDVKASISLSKSSFAAFLGEVKAMKPDVKVSVSLLKGSVAAFLAEARAATRDLSANVDLKFTSASAAHFRSDAKAALSGIGVAIEPKFTQASIAQFRADVKAALSGMSVSIDIKVNKPSIVAARVESAALMSAGGGFAASGARAANSWGGGFFGILRHKIPLFAGFFGNAPLISHISVLSLALHILVDALIILIPAAVTAAAGLAAFGIAAYDSGKKVVQQFQNMMTVGNALDKTIPPLTGNLKKMQEVVRPQVFQLLGAGLNAAGKNAGTFNRLATATGGVLNTLAAKVDVMINRSGQGLNNFLKAGGTDLKMLGQVLSSIGHIFLEVVAAGEKTKIAQHLLAGLAVVLNILDHIVTAVGPNVLAAAIAFFAFVHYGGLAVTAIGAVSRKLDIFSSNTVPKATAAVKAMGSALLSMSPAAVIVMLAVVAAAIAVIIYKAHQADAATKSWIDGMNRGLASIGAGSALPTLVSDIGQVTQKIDVMKATNAPGYFAQAGAGAKIMGDLLHFNVVGAFVDAKNAGKDSLRIIGIGLDSTANDIKALTAEQQKLIGQFNNVGAASYYAMTKGFSFSQSLGILNAAGVKVNDTFAVMKQKVDNLITGYEAMGQKGGVIGADMNALSVVASDQVSAMDKLNQAWDKFIGFLTAPPTTFLAWDSALESFNKAAGVAGATMQGLGKGPAVKFTTPKISSASVALQNQFEQVINASQASLDALRNSNALGGTNNFVKSVKDMVSVLIPLTGGSKAAVAQVSALAQEAGGPATLNIKALSRWSGNQGAAGAMKDYYKQSNLAVTSTYNLNIDAQNLSKTLQSDLTPAMAAAILHASGARQAMDKFASVAINAHRDVTKLYGPGKSLLDSLVKSGVSPTSAKSMITGMLQYMKFTPAQIKQFWSGIQKGPNPVPIHTKVVIPQALQGEMNHLASVIAAVGSSASAKAAARSRLIQDFMKIGQNSKTAALMADILSAKIAYQGNSAQAKAAARARLIQDFKALGQDGRRAAISADALGTKITYQGNSASAKASARAQLIRDFMATGKNAKLAAALADKLISSVIGAGNASVGSAAHFFNFAGKLGITRDEANKLWAKISHQNLDFVGARAKASYGKFMEWAHQAGLSRDAADKLWRTLARQNMDSWLTGKVGVSKNSFLQWTSKVGLSKDQADKLWRKIGEQKFDFLTGRAQVNKRKFEELTHQFGLNKDQADRLWAMLRKQELDRTTAKANAARAAFNKLHGVVGDLGPWGRLTGYLKHTVGRAIADTASGLSGLGSVYNTMAKALGTGLVPLATGAVGAIGKLFHFAHGGVLPGYAPGKDTIPVMASPGEGWLVPEAVQGIGGPGAIDAINHKFAGHRGAGKPGRNLKHGMQAFATGGQVASYATSFNGHRYVWGGGSNPQTGWDCSSFINFLVGHFGYSDPSGAKAPYSGHGPVVNAYEGYPHVAWNKGVVGDLALENNDGHIGILIANASGGNPIAGFAARSTATGTGFQTFGSGAFHLVKGPWIPGGAYTGGVGGSAAVLSPAQQAAYDKGSKILTAAEHYHTKGPFASLRSGFVDKYATEAKTKIDSVYQAKLAALAAAGAAGNSGNGPAGGATGTNLANGKQLYAYLLHNLFGGNKIAAAGATASIWGESMWNPSASGTGGRGLIGWTPPSSISNADFSGGMRTQLPAILRFVTSSGDSATIAAMFRAGSVAAAANLWMKGVERAGVSDVHGTGLSLATSFMDSGFGTLKPGLNYVYNGTGSDEPIRAMGQSMSSMRGLPGRTYGGDGAATGMEGVADSRVLRYLDRIARATETAPAKTGPHVARALNTTSGAAAARSRYSTGSGY